MAPMTPRTNRATRASTRSQTAKSRDNTHASKGPQKTGRLEKSRTKRKATGKAKPAAQPKPKPAAEPPPKYPKEAPEEPIDADAVPQNATPFTINDDRLKSPLICHQYTPLPTRDSPTPSSQIPLIFTHGAGGTLSAPAVTNFCAGFSRASPTPVLAFQGSMNLGARVKGFRACYDHISTALGGAQKELLLGGRSMGARAAVTAAAEIAAQEEGARVRLLLVSYPLQGPKDVRDRILLDLCEGVEVLFVVGERDAMCPLDLLEEVREKMRAVSRVVVVRGADHGMNVRPKSKTREVGEEAGRVAARWVGGEIEREGEVVYVGDGM